jgi:hypothetical protein
MRALEIASVHAMGTTHPVGLILSSGDLENPWLARFVREALHPLARETRSSGVCQLLDDVLKSSGRAATDFVVPPERTNDPAASRYCPRCHSMYLEKVESCPDCDGLPLRDLPLG